MEGAVWPPLLVLEGGSRGGGAAAAPGPRLSARPEEVSWAGGEEVGILRGAVLCSWLCLASYSCSCVRWRRRAREVAAPRLLTLLPERRRPVGLSTSDHDANASAILASITKRLVDYSPSVGLNGNRLTGVARDETQQMQSLRVVHSAQITVQDDSIQEAVAIQTVIGAPSAALCRDLTLQPMKLSLLTSLRKLFLSLSLRVRRSNLDSESCACECNGSTASARKS